MKARHILLAVIVMVLLVGPAQADFILTGTQHIDVTGGSSVDPWFVSTGILFDASTAIVTNGYISNAYVNDEALLSVQRKNCFGVWVNESAIGTARTYNTGRVELYSGRVGELYAYDTSSVDVSTYTVDVSVSAVSVSGLYAYGTSSVDVSGGTVNYLLEANDSSIVNISGGTVSYLQACDTSSVDISGGAVSSLCAYDSGAVNISGGSIYDLSAYGHSDVIIHAYDYRVTGGLSAVSNEILGTGVLIYKFDEYDDWHLIDISGHDIGATIQIIPEPATLGLLLLGGLALLRRRRLG